MVRTTSSTRASTYPTPKQFFVSCGTYLTPASLDDPAQSHHRPRDQPACPKVAVQQTTSTSSDSFTLPAQPLPRNDKAAPIENKKQKQQAAAIHSSQIAPMAITLSRLRTPLHALGLSIGASYLALGSTAILLPRTELQILGLWPTKSTVDADECASSAFLLSRPRFVKTQ